MTTPKAGPYNGPISQNYPREQWWVAATSDEVTRTPMQRWILDYPVVLYRKEDGKAVEKRITDNQKELGKKAAELKALLGR